MRNFKLMILMLGALFMIQNTYAQKGKITSAQLNLQDGKVMDAKKDIDAALLDSSIQKRYSIRRILTVCLKQKTLT